MNENESAPSKEDSGAFSRFMASPAKVLGLAGALSLAVVGGWWHSLQDPTDAAVAADLPTVQGPDGKERPFAWGATAQWSKPAKPKWFGWLGSSKWKNRAPKAAEEVAAVPAAELKTSPQTELAPVNFSGANRGPSLGSSLGGARPQAATASFLSARDAAPPAQIQKPGSVSPAAEAALAVAQNSAPAPEKPRAMMGSVLLGELAEAVGGTARAGSGGAAPSETTFNAGAISGSPAGPAFALPESRTGKAAPAGGGGPILAMAGGGGAGGPIAASGPRGSKSAPGGSAGSDTGMTQPPPNSGYVTAPSQTPPAQGGGAGSGNSGVSTGGGTAMSSQIQAQADHLQQAIKSVVSEAAQPGVAAEQGELKENKDNSLRAQFAASGLERKLKDDMKFFSGGVTAGPAVRPDVANRAASAASSVGQAMGSFLGDVVKSMESDLKIKDQLKEFNKVLSDGSNCMGGVQKRLTDGASNPDADSACLAASRAAWGHKVKLQLTNQQIRASVAPRLDGGAGQLGEIDRNNHGKGMKVAGWLDTARGKLRGEKQALADLDKALKQEARDKDKNRKAVAARAGKRTALEAERVKAVASAVLGMNLPATPEEKNILTEALTGGGASLAGAASSWKQVESDPKNPNHLTLSNDSTLQSVSQLRRAVKVLKDLKKRAAAQEKK